MGKIKNLINKFETADIGFGLWLATALCIIYVRDALETIVVDGSFPFVHPFHLVHVPLFFLSLLLGIIVVLHFFSKTPIEKVSKAALVLFLVILLPPVADLVINLFRPRPVFYGYIEMDLLKNFVNFFNPFFSIETVPASLRIEIALIVILSFLFILLKRSNFISSLLGGLFVFLACFLFGALPGIFINLFLFFRPLLSYCARFINVLFHNNTARHAVVRTGEGVLQDPSLLILELILAVALAGIWFWRYDRAKCAALMKNLRLIRVLHYLLLTGLGLALYFYQNVVTDLFIFLKVIGIFGAVFFAFEFAVVINDICDVAIDEKSNTQRPLVAGVLNKEEFLRIGFFYLAFSLLFAFFVGDFCFAITLFAVVLSVLYSAPPLRLKAFFPASVVFIGAEALTVFLIGQVSLDPKGKLLPVYGPIWLLVFLVFFLSANVKDLKDVEGDRAAGVTTLPVIFGEPIARKIIACLVFLSYMAVPFVLTHSSVLSCSNLLYVSSFVFGIVNLWYIPRQKAKEKVVFFMYFAYVFPLLLSIT
jgi:4-hydroxybenzoate polyprenyltransferase